jgi:hypothetical protein
VKWLTENDIDEFLCQRDYDLRLSNNGRWIDQKCAADVVTVIADCIQQYSLLNENKEFSSMDIWHDSYTINNVESVFKKPNPSAKAARNEYDKFFQQPMEMLAYAGVLSKHKRGKRNFYSVANYEVLEYLALREKNTLIFLGAYIKKVLTDSSIYWVFDDFFTEQSKKAYNVMKKEYAAFIIYNTNINGELECNRIFIKILNPIAYMLNKKGTERGTISRNAITYDMLMYNRNNFRDNFADKPKGMTRKEYTTQHSVEINTAYYRYQSEKAKRILRVFNKDNRNSISEHIQDGQMEDKATQIHHIFPESEYPEISFFLENLIALTPTQHFNYAHPNGKTSEVDEQYQHLLLLSKTERVNENLTCEVSKRIYEFIKLLTVLSIGFENDLVMEIVDMDFNAVVNAINIHYRA